MKKKTVTILAIDYSKKICDPQPQFINRMEVRTLATNAYRAGYNKAKSEDKKSSLTKEEYIRLIEVLRTLEGMGGTTDDFFNKDCKDAGKLARKLESKK